MRYANYIPQAAPQGALEGMMDFAVLMMCFLICSMLLENYIMPYQNYITHQPLQGERADG